MTLWIEIVLLDAVADRLEDVAVLNHVVELVVAGDLTRELWIAFISPEAITPRNRLPLRELPADRVDSLVVTAIERAGLVREQRGRRRRAEGDPAGRP
ncbi:hypothetical protein [Halosolutus halophilus]|uniref:hypothetical protein n=1 Tax=Halosolutus halophilus TaxID=1552990 RepID=UPI0022350064|nr:hypothetical protein [Halosolutus halophilus]